MDPLIYESSFQLWLMRFLQVVAEESEEEKVDDKVSREFHGVKLTRLQGMWCVVFNVRVPMVFSWCSPGIVGDYNQ